jgi:hypothetical protein
MSQPRSYTSLVLLRTATERTLRDLDPGQPEEHKLALLGEVRAAVEDILAHIKQAR